MDAVFQKYRERLIRFHDTRVVEEWSIKIYTISNQRNFSSGRVYDKTMEKLPVWIQEVQLSSLPTYKQAFLILHEAREGVWILLNWWTGGEMIETKLYFTKYGDPVSIAPPATQSNGLLCVWELEIFAHERKAWINHVLMNPKHPQLESYSKEVYNREL